MASDGVLFHGWCVMVMTKRGVRWSSPTWSGRTRSEAINQYIGAKPGDEVYPQWRKLYEREVRRGDVKCVRYTATATPDAEEQA